MQILWSIVPIIRPLSVFSPEFATAAVAPDGIIEAIVAKDKSRYAVGVQWHPETLLPVSGIFSDFVAAAAKAALPGGRNYRGRGD